MYTDDDAVEIVYSGVYEIVDPTGRSYVGVSCDIPKRWMQHRTLLRRGKHHSKSLQDAWNHYGEDKIVFRVIEGVPDRDDLCAAEEAAFRKRRPAHNASRASGYGVISDEALERRRVRSFEADIDVAIRAGILEEEAAIQMYAIFKALQGRYARRDDDARTLGRHTYSWMADVRAAINGDNPWRKLGHADFDGFAEDEWFRMLPCFTYRKMLGREMFDKLLALCDNPTQRNEKVSSTK